MSSLQRFARSAFAVALLTSGCGSGHTDTNASATATTLAQPGRGADVSDAPTPAAHHHRRRHRHGHAGGAAAVAGGSALAGGAAVAAAQPAPVGSDAYPCDNAKFLSDQSQFGNGALQGDQEVDVCGTVTNVLSEKDTRSGLHGYYDLQIAPGNTIEIVCALGEMNAPAWPWVKAGDYSYVQGRYYYDSAARQGIDWTHHGTSRSWPNAGYVVVAGTRYE
jgi:hypothetical protein